MENTTVWHAASVDETLSVLQTDLQQGLGSEKARQRLAEFSPNELAERPRPGFWHMLLAQFNNFLIIILIASALLSLALKEFEEAVAILAIVILNAILGIVQERRAEEALAALQKMAAPEAHVLRDGHRVAIPARELVPGDVVFLEAGNYVPADLRIVESANLRADEASLTGESIAVEKKADCVLAEDTTLGDRVNLAFMGSTITYGRGVGVVVLTGMRTQIGLIAEMIQSYEEEATPLQRRLDQLGRWLGWGALVICALVFIVAVVRDTEIRIILQQGTAAYFGQYAEMLRELFLTAVSLAIAAVPEGLPAVVTICLAMGMQEMVRRHALIRRLPAVETLGSATAICSDKTGTLTQNEMTAVRLYVANLRLDISGEGYQPQGAFDNYGTLMDPQDYPEALALLTGGLLCSDAQLEKDEDGYRMVGDPTEGALVVAAAKADLWREEVEARMPRVAELPFDSDRKCMTTIHTVPEQGPVGRAGERRSDYVVYVKGAPDVILGRCHSILEGGHDVELTAARRQHVENVNRDLGQEALRVLAVAYRMLDELPEKLEPEEIERDLTLVGLVAMIDPARPEVRPAVEKARHAGIRTMMVTGDYPDTARAIAKEIGLLRPEGQVVSGAELNEMSDEELSARIEQVDVFARVSPRHKVRIIEALRAHNHVVAMTGDGVNDAPALKRADIGVAMGITGTDVSKEVADMVLTDDNYASIVAAIERGRIIYSNIRKFVYYLLSCNMAEIMIIFLATLAGQPPPLTPIQLLWLNLLTDGAPALALSLEQGDPDIMDRPPRPTNEPIINREMLRGIIVQTIAITVAVLSAYAIGLRWDNGSRELARTMAFVTLSASELLRAYTARSERYPLFKLGVFSNRTMQYAVGASLLLLLGVVYLPFLQPFFDTVPLGLKEWAVVAPLLFIPAVVAEINKAIDCRATSRSAG
ncbi:MAG: cation-translocating P-type ATPase [Anaerolineae bacterium]|nr:cation-translocating P-type ATPase [Anaerolineae bacterium]